jgi:hypothetical protein
MCHLRTHAAQRALHRTKLNHPIGDIRRVRLPAPILIDRQVRFLMLIVHAQEGGAFVSVAIKSKT